jgi:hypothetical protein
MAKSKVIPFPASQRASLARPREYTLRVYLVSGPYGEESVGSEIFRTLKIRGDQTLEDLHRAISRFYERQQHRYYEFCLGVDPYDPQGVRYTSGEAVSKYGLNASAKPSGKLRLAPLATVDSLGLSDDQFFGYWFDLIEEWIHLIHVIGIEPSDAEADYPLLVETQGGLPAPAFPRGRALEGGYGPERFREEDVLILLMGEMQMRWRNKVEDAPLRPNTHLKTALAKLPSHWLEAVCRQAGLEDARNRKGRIDGFAEWLRQEENLRKAWDSLPLPSREVLRWILLERHGSVRMQNLSRRFGPDTDITWWWHEGQTPETPFGLLRSKGLVYVGKIREGKRRVRIAVVPADLRRTLTGIARDARSMEGGPPLAPVKPSPGPPEPSEESFAQECLLEMPKPESPHADPWKGLDSFNLRSFLSVCPLRGDTEGLYSQTLGRIRRNPEGFPRRHVRSFLTRMIQDGSVWSRLEAYKLGFTLLDERFAHPALSDRSRLIRRWARGVFASPQESLF